MNKTFIGKTLLLEDDERVLVIGDLHLGYEHSLRESGVFVYGGLVKRTLDEMKQIFDKTGKVDKVILMGDVKHLIGGILRDERNEIVALLEFLASRTKEIVIVKGNHDAILDPLLIGKEVKACDFYCWNGYCFVHGDKDIESLYDKNIKGWVMGHFHPAIMLRRGAKQELYKCFLVGKHKGREIIIVPSFFSANEGTDPRFGMGNEWNFNFSKFRAWVVGDNLEVLDFGQLSSIDSLV